MNKRSLLLAGLALVFSVILSGQTKTNVEKLNQLSQQFNEEWNLKQAEVQEFAERNNLEVEFETPEGVLFRMVEVRDGVPLYYATDNYGAAITTRADHLWVGGSTGLELTGDGYDQLGSWDGGKVRTTHQEFTDQGSSRVTNKDNTSGIHFHAVHVAGTLVAAGVVEDAQGMAYEASLKAWDWLNDYSEMTSAGASGMELSNHSYGVPAGWVFNGSQWNWYGNSSVSDEEDYRFGFYEAQSRQADLISFNAPYYLIVTSAGNSRGDGPPDAGVGSNPPVNGGDDGFDCIPGHYAVGKNTLTVGAVKEVLEYSGPESVLMTSFSSWGPADDGRIKPDIVAKGFSVYSTLEGSDTDYGSQNGTSMACPNTTGTLVLLRQHYQGLNGGDIMRSATLKGLVIHTADECGPDPGPDYMFGWGLVNAKRAAGIITDDQGQNVLDELVLDENDTYTRELSVPEDISELRVTMCWTDPAGYPTSAQLNPTTLMNVNDLDISIEDEGGTTYYPYSLDVSNPSAAASNDEKNYADNVEMVSIMLPEAGTYTITVGHDGGLANDEQAFSLIITGIDEYTEAPDCADNLLSPEDGAENVLPNQWTSWIPAPFASSYDVYFGTDGGGTETPTNVYNGENFPTNGFSPVMDINTTYYLQVVPRNSIGPAEDCSTIWSFTTMDAISEFPYLEDVESVDVPEIPESWNTQDFSEIVWASTSLTSNSGDNAMGCYNPDGLIETDMDNWFVSPPISVEEGLSYPVSFYYRNFIPDHAESLSLYWGNSPDAASLTNQLFQAIDFTGSDWQLAWTSVTPAEDGIVFLGWHSSSTAGYGVFLDDIEITAGSVNVDESSDRGVKVLSSNGKLLIKAGEEWNGADVRVFNLTGQEVYAGEYFQNASIDLDTHQDMGLFLITLQKDDRIFSEKIIIR